MVHELNAFTKDRRGNAAVWMLGLLIVILMFFCLMLEVQRIYNLHYQIETKIVRSANNAVESAMLDTQRQDYILELDTAAAKIQFQDFLVSDLALTPQLRHMDNNGTEIYHLSMTVTAAANGTLVVAGNIYIDTMLAALVGQKQFILPYKYIAHNQRTVS